MLAEQELTAVAGQCRLQTGSGLPSGFRAATPAREAGRIGRLFPVVVVGCSGHAAVVLDAIEESGRFSVVGLLDSFKVPGTELLAYEIIGSEAELPMLLRAGVCEGVIVAIGDNWTRSQVVRRIRERVPNVPLATVIHPSAQIARGVSIGAGTVVLAGAVVNVGSQIGECCIVNTCASLDHDCVMGDFASLAPRATTGGGVTIGSHSAICIGATLSHCVYIGDHSVIGAGALVLNDIPANVVAYGMPAHVVRERQPHEPYLERSTAAKTAPAAQASRRQGAGPPVKLIPVSSPEWEHLLGRTQHDFYHTALYHEVQQRFGAGEAILAVYGDADKFVLWPYLLREIPSSRQRVSCTSSGLYDVTSVYGYSGPLAHACEEDEQFLHDAWTAVQRVWMSQSVVTAFTRFHPLLRNHEWLPEQSGAPAAAAAESGLLLRGHTIALDVSKSPDDIWAGYAGNNRRQIRKCRANGVTVELDAGWEHFERFIELYYATMKRNHAAGFYFFPLQYLRALWHNSNPYATVMVARYEDRVIASLLLFEYGGRVSAHLMGADSETQLLSPCKLLIHESLIWAASRGNRVYHLGGGRGGKDDDPLFRFKLAFSKTVSPFYVGRWILNEDLYDRLSRERRAHAAMLRDRMLDEGHFPLYRAPFLFAGGV